MYLTEGAVTAEVYIPFEVSTGVTCILKISRDPSALDKEWNMYKLLIRFPSVRGRGTVRNFGYLALENVGRSTEASKVASRDVE